MSELFKSEMSYENRLDKDDLVDIPFDIDILIYNETKVIQFFFHLQKYSIIVIVRRSCNNRVVGGFSVVGQIRNIRIKLFTVLNTANSDNYFLYSEA